MKSHPEEFKRYEGTYNDRWYDDVNAINAYGNEADKAALATGLREIRLAEIHEKVMDELLNGDERRRMAREENEYERNLSKSLLLTKQQQMQQAQQQQLQGYRNAYANKLGAYDADLDMYRNAATHMAGQGPSLKAVGTTGTGATLASSAINQIKKALKF
jgi:hypothetical protein